MKNKRYLYALTGLISLLICMGSGCQKEKEMPTGPQEESGKQVSRFDASLMGVSFKGFCDSGYCYYENGLVTFHEYESNLIYPLCSEAYCDHAPQSDNNPDSNCEAVQADVTSAVIHGNYLYLFQMHEIGKTVVNVRNLLESGYKQLTELPYALTETVPGIYNEIQNDKAWLIATDMSDLTDISGGVSQQDYPTVILELNLSTGKYEELFRMEAGPQIRKITRTKEGIVLSFLKGVGGGVQVDENGDVLLDENGKVTFLPYKLYNLYFYVDINTKECKELTSLMPDGGLVTDVEQREEDKRYLIGFSEDGILVKRNRTMYLMDPKTEALEELWTLPDGYTYFYASSLGEHTVTMYMENKQGGKRGLFVIDTKEFKEIDYGENFSGISYFGDDYYCCSYYYGDYTKMCLIHYQDLINGTRKTLTEWIQ